MKRRNLLKVAAGLPILFGLKSAEAKTILPSTPINHNYGFNTKGIAPHIAEVLKDYEFAAAFRIRRYEPASLTVCNLDGSPITKTRYGGKRIGFETVHVPIMDLETMKTSLFLQLNEHINNCKNIISDFDPKKHLYIVLVEDGTMVGICAQPFSKNQQLRLTQDVMAEINAGKWKI